jgi:hypothetical protein
VSAIVVPVVPVVDVVGSSVVRVASSVEVLVVDGSAEVSVVGEEVSVVSSLDGEGEQPGRNASAPLKNGRVWIKKPSRMGHRDRCRPSIHTIPVSGPARQSSTQVRGARAHPGLTLWGSFVRRHAERVAPAASLGRLGPTGRDGKIG